MVRMAHAEPQLRQLYPWTGMWELHFSRCTGCRRRVKSEMRTTDGGSKEGHCVIS
ncbi:DUF6193 family natural product biosynthesis protein [Streptomyces sp. NBC_01788]|uniref:DUF6193 family natural product biosynthesis protein n=1 Tax=Streptomyces sp. NBC_01788 TaxID=2975940 RepID=UPI002DDAC615|nr:DUF6193 family natural product biosynthesis protein [Streptomyces sp. NBC_01788]WSB31402.1 DUF6193 family natural product biosynthesis protein [Streptomyces sp. NBC_01788]